MNGERVVAEVYCPPCLAVRAMLRVLSYGPPGVYAVVERWSSDRSLKRYRRL